MVNNWQEIEKKYYLRTFDRVPLTIARGSGVKVWDDHGKEYLDFVGGWAVTNLGHCHPVITKAITKQAKTLLQTSNQFYTIPQLQLADILVKHSCLQRAFFANSGTEANEGAVKLARRYGKLRLNGAYEVISATNSFHGRTLAMTAATGQSKFQEPYQPLPVGFKNVEYGNIEALKQMTSKQTCAVMLELVQGESGVHEPAPDYFNLVRKWCDEKGILLILDEIQTGLGRLGSLWGYEQFGIEPDIMTLAKGLANGIPIGALLAKEKASVFVAGEHGSTFGGNPFACAVAYVTVKFIIEKNIPDNARIMGKYFLHGLGKLKQRLPVIVDVRGRGLLLAIEFNKDMANTVLMNCLDKGLLVNKVKPNALRFMPPLIITKEDVDKALGILDNVLSNAGA
jgi:acetylornithine/N-succinyldiaminopimelate aminotransferase